MFFWEKEPTPYPPCGEVGPQVRVGCLALTAGMRAISPLVGEMSGRTEGGAKDRNVSAIQVFGKASAP